MIQIEIKGIKKVSQFIADLPKSTERELGLVSMDFSKRVQKSAKLRAPRMTGELAQSIIIKPDKKNEISIVVESPYGYFQEFGYKPHWVSALTSTRNSLGTIGNAYNISGFMFVSKYKPFIMPALEVNLTNLPNMLRNGVNKAIIGAKR
jgi:hypothetical protein